MNEELLKIGFTKHEAQVYLALVKSGSTGAGELIKKTNLHRNIVYETLDKLASRELVFKFKKHKVAQFQVTDPSRILEQERNRVEVAEELVPKLIKEAQVKQDIVIYEGIEGFRTYNISLVQKMATGDTVFVLGSAGDLWYELMGNQLDRHRKIWEKKKIYGKSIVYKQSRLDQKLPRYESRIIPNEFEPPADMLIWKDTIALQCLVEPYSVIEITNPPLAKAYLAYFELLWNQANTKK